MLYDVIIIGSGPAGATAAIYTSRSRMKTLVLEDSTALSQAGYASCIENFPGFEEGISGPELLQRLKKQAIKFGAEILSMSVSSIVSKKEDEKEIWAVQAEGKEHKGLSIIIASGAKDKRLDIPGEGKLCGRGVSYCATCDGAFFKDKTIAVVGGGNSAIEDALFLTRFAQKVILIHRRNRLRADKILQERAKGNKKIEFLMSSTVEKILGEQKVEGLMLNNVTDGTAKEVSLEGIFISIGYVPNTGFAQSLLELNEKKQIIVDDMMRTSQKGIFASGDCRNTPLRQVITACGDGAQAAYSCRLYTEELKGIAYK